MRKNLGEEQ